MEKFLFRRISAGIVIISFLLPWFEDFFMNYSGLNMIIEGYKEGYEETVFLATFSLITLVFALLLVVIPKLVPTILFLIPGVLWLVLFYSGDMADYRMYGTYVYTLGVVGIFISFFIKKGNKGNVASIPVQNEVASTIEVPQKATAAANNTVFCKNCGNEMNV